MWACRALASLPPAAAPQGPCSRRALLQGRPSRTVRPLQRCPAADGEAEAATDAAAAGTTSLPPLKQMPYQAIATLAAVGVADTAYLSAVKLLHLTPACPLSGGCVDVLTSEYASLFGIVPLAFVGLAAYASMGALALTGARQAAAARAVAAETASSSSSSGGDDATSSRAEPEQDESPLRSAVLAGGLVMASTSSVLLYILFTHFPGDLCPWCLGSAALSFAIAATAASGLRQGEVEEAAAPGAGIVAATLLFMTVALGGVNDSAFASGGYDLDYALPAVTTSSPPKAVALAERLRAGGARMYGAFWCSHCYDQKQTFGAEAMAAFPYVECYPEGLHKDTKMAAACQSAPGGLTGFPTWVLPDGQQLVGEQTFEQLEEALDKALAAATEGQF